MVLGVNLGFEEITILVFLVAPLIAIGIKVYFMTLGNHQCLERLERKVDDEVIKAEHIHNEMRELMREQQNFFINWIQRVEDVTRDRYNKEQIMTMTPAKTLNEEDRVLTQKSSLKHIAREYDRNVELAAKMDEVINAINLLVKKVGKDEKVL